MSQYKFGIVDTTRITFKSSSTITNISQSSGSILGGTLITITGTNFSTTLVD
ncbi:MAG: IPT/TIG domain-containing protein [bacterium]